MRKSLSLLLLLCMASLYSKAQESTCPNRGQVFRTGCPSETLENCGFGEDECNYASTGIIEGEIYKWEDKKIGWANGVEDIEHPAGFGFCYLKENCDGSRSDKRYWPKFMPPVVTSTSWRQDVISQFGDCYNRPCGGWFGAFQCDIDERTRTFDSDGSCATVEDGGGGGDDEGGGSDGGGGGGCTSCDCYYQTVYTYTPTGAGECYHVYQREEYLCGGQIQWQSPDQYTHTCCICEELQ